MGTSIIRCEGSILALIEYDNSTKVPESVPDMGTKKAKPKAKKGK